VTTTPIRSPIRSTWPAPVAAPRGHPKGWCRIGPPVGSSSRTPDAITGISDSRSRSARGTYGAGQMRDASFPLQLERFQVLIRALGRSREVVSVFGSDWSSGYADAPIPPLHGANVPNAAAAQPKPRRSTPRAAAAGRPRLLHCRCSRRGGKLQSWPSRTAVGIDCDTAGSTYFRCSGPCTG
jgi:hypothetical protein